MNNQQSSEASTNQLNLTGNPQDVGNPVLLPSSGNLQGQAVTANNLNTSGTSGIILSNNQAIFTPDTSPPSHKNTARPYLIGASVLFLLIAIVLLAIMWRQNQAKS